MTTYMNMMIRKKAIYFICLIVIVMSFAGCKKDTARGVAPEEAAIIQDLSDEEENPDGERVDINTKVSKTSEKLDPASLPAEVEKMVTLCDAINIVQVESARSYNEKDDEFVWRAIQIAITQADLKDDEYTDYDNKVGVDPEIVNEFAYAMFGKLKRLPNLPESVLRPDWSQGYEIEMSNGFDYIFRKGDRGLSSPRVVNAISYSDASVELQVMLEDSVNHSEIASFIYTMRSNTRNTSASARYVYEITNVRAADSLTSELMKGMPYITMLSQIYGRDSYDEDDLRCNMVVELPYFSTFGEADESVKGLNARIDEEISGLADESLAEDEDASSYVRMISYPVTNNHYAQVLVTYDTYPGRQDYGIKSYNYNFPRRKAMDLNDALEIAGIDEKELLENAQSAYEATDSEDESDSINKLEYSAFMVRENGSVDFYFLTSLEGSSESYISKFNNADNEFVLFNEEDNLIPDNMLDSFETELNHGR